MYMIIDENLIIIEKKIRGINSIIEKCTPWFSHILIKPHYENGDICLPWDIPGHLGYEVEEESKTKDLMVK